MQVVPAAALAVSLAAAPALAATWELDPAHSEVGFRVRHMAVSWTRGRFDAVSGKLELDEKDLSKSKAEVAIETKSVNTSVKDRDDHLRSADFFDVEKFPKMTFVSKKFEQRGDKLTIEGELTLHGVTKTVKLEGEALSKPAKDPWGNLRIGTRATAKLSRKDFGLTWNKALELGGVLVGDDVEIALEVEFTRKA